ncbi:hypothetical protein C8R44DRAFT_755065 [Mycena epipterygia]|nr:hypothetical protein C8R44DRAFT_755065 [Mycena epipterygia]
MTWELLSGASARLNGHTEGELGRSREKNGDLAKERVDGRNRWKGKAGRRGVESRLREGMNGQDRELRRKTQRQVLGRTWMEERLGPLLVENRKMPNLRVDGGIKGRTARETRFERAVGDCITTDSIQEFLQESESQFSLTYFAISLSPMFFALCATSAASSGVFSDQKITFGLIADAQTPYNIGTPEQHTAHHQARDLAHAGGRNPSINRVSPESQESTQSSGMQRDEDAGQANSLRVSRCCIKYTRCAFASLRRKCKVTFQSENLPRSSGAIAGYYVVVIKSEYMRNRSILTWLAGLSMRKIRLDVGMPNFVNGMCLDCEA